MARLLIVSEDRLLAEVVRVCLSAPHVEAEVVSSVEAFEERTRRAAYELVVVVMVELFFSGRALVERLRPRGAVRPQLFVLSWHQNEETVVGLLEAGVDQVMTFPFNAARLRGKALTVLRND